MISSHERPSAVHNATDVKGAEDMGLSQSLRTCFRSDFESKKRLCHTGRHMGLFISSHLTKDNIAPSVAGLIPGTKRTEDFDEDAGSFDIRPIIEISKKILSQDHKNHRGIFMEGKAGLDALIDVICNGGHSVKTLTESDLNVMIGLGYHNLRLQAETMETAHALFMKNNSNSNNCLVFNCQQMASTRYFSGIFSMNGCILSTQ
jgi:hypothetical protein